MKISTENPSITIEKNWEEKYKNPFTVKEPYTAVEKKITKEKKENTTAAAATTFPTTELDASVTRADQWKAIATRGAFFFYTTRSEWLTISPNPVWLERAPTPQQYWPVFFLTCLF